jgi:hypothetical protein
MRLKLKTRFIPLALAVMCLHCQIAKGAGVFAVRQFGAAGDGTNKDTAALQRAIDAASATGGGTVTFSAGTYLSGSIFLKSHVKLRLDPGAVLLGSPQRSDYRSLNFLALILADQQEDIGIEGTGVINGQGRLLAVGYEMPLTSGKWPKAREAKRPVVINFRNCRNIAIRGVTLTNSACWMQLYRDCENVTVENVTVRNISALTNDGLDIDGCTHVIVRGCDIDSEDDSICLKSTDRACDDVLVEKCRLRSTCNALKFGTASFVGFKNITCCDLEIYDTYISALALELVDGGTMENVQISRVKMTDCNNAIFLRLGHRNEKVPVGSFRNVTISDVTAEIPNRPQSAMNKFPTAWRHHCTTLVTASITGLPENPVRNVTLKNISIVYGGIGSNPKTTAPRLEKLGEISEQEEHYPESTMFGVLPAWGFYCRHADGVNFENVTLRVKGKDYRPALVCDDVKNLRLDGFHVLSAGKEPVIYLNDLQGAVIRNSPAPAGTITFIKTNGNTRNISSE